MPPDPPKKLARCAPSSFESPGPAKIITRPAILQPSHLWKLRVEVSSNNVKR